VISAESASQTLSQWERWQVPLGAGQAARRRGCGSQNGWQDGGWPAVLILSRPYRKSPFYTGPATGGDLMGRVLAMVFAHPDDDAYAAVGGLVPPALAVSEPGSSSGSPVEPLTSHQPVAATALSISNPMATSRRTFGLVTSLPSKQLRVHQEPGHRPASYGCQAAPSQPVSHGLRHPRSGGHGCPLSPCRVRLSAAPSQGPADKAGRAGGCW
jgi:hypothetical protein